MICVVFVAEAAAPAAAIGNSQFSWWIFLIIAFLMPYGLIVCELGTTYADDEGGIADWVRRAFGDKWGSRVSWYYWINFPLWMASLAFLFPETIALMTGFELDLIPTLAIELAFVWIVVFMSFSKVSDSGWILNLSAVLKVLIAVSVGGLGIYYAVTNGFASDMSPATFLPSMDASSLTYLSIILFNFMGFEAIAVFANDMENPKKQIPTAIIAGGIAIAAIYLFSSFGIGAAIPSNEVSLDSGIMDAVAIMAGNGSLLFIAIGVVFLITLFGNMISWSFGVNYVAAHAADKKTCPACSRGSTRRALPTGAALVNGVIASAPRARVAHYVGRRAGRVLLDILLDEHRVPADLLHADVPGVPQAALGGSRSHAHLPHARRQGRRDGGVLGARRAAHPVDDRHHRVS